MTSCVFLLIEELYKETSVTTSILRWFFFFVSLLFIFDSGPVNSKITRANLHNVAAATAAAAATATAANAVHTEQVH